ncbi:toll/interleukin-1 receptor domain-containing protein [Paenirhodobacter ferrireducens]|nr:toll/interleukin-1 receptor domain-containing protein [Sinirhodobacter ferrireducens]
MRVFLSHSSVDKGFVEAVAHELKPGTYELDSETFDAGILNSAAIIKALNRADIFCIFLSGPAIDSHYVDFETGLAIELAARGTIQRILPICLDETSFQRASSVLKLFNIVRKQISPESAARLIQGTMISVGSEKQMGAHPFIGREREIEALEAQTADPNRPPSKALYVSGIYGSGRRTLVRKFYSDQFPEVNQVFPKVSIPSDVGIEELFRLVLFAAHPNISVKNLQAYDLDFSMQAPEKKAKTVADLISSFISQGEALIMEDEGGLLEDSGDFTPDAESVIKEIANRPHPPLAVVARRMMPMRFRRNDVAYANLTSFDHKTSRRLMSKVISAAGISANPAQVDQLTEMSEGHPYNHYRIVEEIQARTLDVFLAEADEFYIWKHRQGTEYLHQIELNDDERKVVAVLTMVPSLDFETLVAGCDLAPEQVAKALERLIDLHVLETAGSVYKIAPPLRIAAEKDPRAAASTSEVRRAVSAIADGLNVRFGDGTAPIQLLDTAIISSIDSGIEAQSYVSALILPSHFVWLMKEKYDQGDYTEAIRLAKEALNRSERLSFKGRVTACRYLCLAASRRFDDDEFTRGIELLEGYGGDAFAQSNINFLKGFRERLKGNLPIAENFFREAYRLSPGSASPARELASICLARGLLEDAESFAREVLAAGSTNSFIYDVLAAALIRKLGKNAQENWELQDILGKLEVLSAEDGRSFFLTRRAELELVTGDISGATNTIRSALNMTPNVFEAHRISAQILIAARRFGPAQTELNWMRERTTQGRSDESRQNYRMYLETQAEFFTETHDFGKARAIFTKANLFTDGEISEARRKIDTAEAYFRK